MTAKNFNKLEVGEWYQARNGAVFQICHNVEEKSDIPPEVCEFMDTNAIFSFYSDGRVFSNRDSPEDLITHIEPLVIVPKKQPLRVEFEADVGLFEHVKTGDPLSEAIGCSAQIMPRNNSGTFYESTKRFKFILEELP